MCGIPSHLPLFKIAIANSHLTIMRVARGSTWPEGLGSVSDLASHRTDADGSTHLAGQVQGSKEAWLASHNLGIDHDDPWGRSHVLNDLGTADSAVGGRRRESPAAAASVTEPTPAPGIHRRRQTQQGRMPKLIPLSAWRRHEGPATCCVMASIISIIGVRTGTQVSSRSRGSPEGAQQP